MLADAIIDLLTHRRKAKLFGTNGTSMVQNEWTKEAMVSGIDAVYRELLTGKGILHNQRNEPA
jgi:hypothetical protein